MIKLSMGLHEIYIHLLSHCSQRIVVNSFSIVGTCLEWLINAIPTRLSGVKWKHKFTGQVSGCSQRILENSFFICRSSREWFIKVNINIPKTEWGDKKYKFICQVAVCNEFSYQPHPKFLTIDEHTYQTNLNLFKLNSFKIGKAVQTNMTIVQK